MVNVKKCALGAGVALLVLASCRDEQVATCAAGASRVDAGAVDPQNLCQSCQPAVSARGYTALADGTSCGAGQVCSAGSCTAGCFVGGALVQPGQVSPTNPCEACAPGTSTAAYSPLPQGTTCGVGRVCGRLGCQAHCFIAGAVVDAGAVSPTNACASCQPDVSTSAFSPRPTGASCGVGQVCGPAGCASQCFIDGGVVAAGSVSPANPCLACVPALSTTAFSPQVDGTSCATGQVCRGGACISGCAVDGGVVDAGAEHGGNACLRCDPLVDPRAWQPKDAGTACGAGAICSGGAACVAACLIGGMLVPADAGNPANPCETCRPAVSTTSYTSLADGTRCGAGQVCYQARCDTGCVVAGSWVDAGAPSPTNTCAWCAPDASTSAYTSRPNGTACSACNSCSAGVCGPTTLADVATMNVPERVALAEGAAYVAINRRDPCCNSSILRVPLDGGAPGMIATALYSPLGLAAGPSGVYVADWQGGDVRRVPLAGGPLALLTTAANPVGVTLDDSRAYFVEQRNPGAGQLGNVVSVLLDGGGRLNYADGGGPNDIVTDGVDVFWIDAFRNTVYRAPVSGAAGGAVPLAGTGGQANRLTVDGTFVYWSTRDAGVLRVAKTGGAVVQVTGPQADAYGVATDGLHLYWANYNLGAGSGGGLARKPLDGGATTQLSTGGSPKAVAVDEQCVYWTTYGGPTLRRMDK